MSDGDARIKALEKEMEELKKSVLSFGKKPRKVTNREPSKYNLFMRKFIIDEKAELGDKYDHKVAFKQAAVEWKKKKESS